MAIKVDLVKAYDRLEWSFIHKVLKAFQFPEELIKLIMSCVSTTSISILLNRGRLTPFMPTRGLRQGDPFSPYLFTLCMEYLGFLINKSCRRDEWTPLKASKHNLGISHLFFADDLMLFAKANKAGADSIQKVLSKFCKESGQLISAEKSCIYFSPNVPLNARDDIYGLLNIAETSCLGKYLGFPLNHRGAGQNRYIFIVEKVITKLSRWKTKFLSFAGRMVLINSVMAAIPNHIMQGVALPSHLCEKLDKVNRDFLWGSSLEKRKLHLVGWNKIIRSKAEGGLGLQAARAKNIALLAKLNWRLYQDKDSIWAKVLLGKYCSQHRKNFVNPDKLPCSSNWAAIKVGFPTFKRGIC